MRTFVFACALLSAVAAFAQEKPPTLYVVGYAHLDTQWRWEYPQTIREFLPNTLRDNFALFGKYPHYVFNFSGANRYRMMKEYYPDDYARLKEYVKAGRWFPAGSSMEEGDVNSPSAESIVRQILYGSRYFRREFGKTSTEFMLPDSFGFPASLPTILAHMGIRGFSTQKLGWGSAVGTPFNVGVWEGPDGSSVIAALNPGSYSADILYDLTSSERPANLRNFIDWPARVRANAVPVDYHYYGTGDVGGAPSDASVARVEEMVAKPKNSLRVLSATAEQMFLDVTPDEAARLPRYKGEMELTQHSAGSLTSEAMQKQWNRTNELLADAAEKASVAAMLLGGRAYPQQRLEDAWTLVMGGQFHDIAAGTATPLAHQYSWNDDVLAMNQFETVLTSAVDSIASRLDTRGEGMPVVVYNALEGAREDVVEVPIGSGAVQVFGPDGKEVPAQVSRTGSCSSWRACRRWASRCTTCARLRSNRRQSQHSHGGCETSLENARYRIRDRRERRRGEHLRQGAAEGAAVRAARLALQTETPQEWPAWNMDWDDRQQPPRAFVGGPATVRIIERGAARVALEIAREAEGSTFVETIRLTAGDAGNRIEICERRRLEAPLRVAEGDVPARPRRTRTRSTTGASAPIARGNNDPKKYEVASHEWIDLTDASGAHRRDRAHRRRSSAPTSRTTARFGLTLLYTPGLGEGSSSAYSPTRRRRTSGITISRTGWPSHDGDRPADAQARCDSSSRCSRIRVDEARRHARQVVLAFCS
jgi:alpha-mannosidase